VVVSRPFRAGAALGQHEGVTPCTKHERIEALLRLIDPGLKDLDLKLAYPALLNAAIEANVRWSIKQLSDVPEAKKALAAGRVTLVGGVYELDTGKVRFLKG
jgi:carbonic anhydrase